MTIVTSPARRALSRILEDFPVPFGTGFGVAVEDAFNFSPGPATLRREELQRSEFGRLGPGLTPDRFQNLMRQAQGLEPLPAEVINERAGLSPLLSAQEARARVGDLGLQIPDEGIREDTLNILIARKREEIRRRNVLSRTSTAAAITGSVAGSMIDPLNIAAAFVPVVGEARFAVMAQRVGATTARAGRGAVEGVVGAALVEPIVVSAARAEQADYDMLDSLLNVAFGTFVGGGLHVLGGFAADAGRAATGRPTLSQQLAAAPVETRERVLRAAVAQAADDRTVRVDPVLAEEQRRLGVAFDEVNARPLGPVNDPLVRLKPDAFEEVIVDRGPALERNGEIVVQGKELERLLGSRAGFGLVKVIVRHGPQSNKQPRFQISRDDLVALPAVLREFEPSQIHRTAEGEFAGADWRVTRPDESFGPREIVFGVRRFSRTDGETRLVTAFVLEPGRDGGMRPAVRRDGGATGSSGIRFKPTAGDTAPRRFDPAGRGRVAPGQDIGPDTPAQQDLFQEWRQDATSDFAASDAVEKSEVAPDTPEAERGAVEAELAEAEAELAALRDRDLLDAAAEKALADMDAAAKRAGVEANAWRAAARCLLT